MILYNKNASRSLMRTVKVGRVQDAAFIFAFPFELHIHSYLGRCMLTWLNAISWGTAL